MATKNAGRFLQEALDSIPAAFGTPNAKYEVLVADASSSDSTLDIARANAAVRIVSHTDSGIYDGMNRAIAAAKGDAILILNSDDTLLPEALGQAVAALKRNTSAAFVSGTAIFGESVANARHRQHRGPLSVEGAMFGVPAINARLFRTAVVRTAGELQTGTGLAADRDWLLRVAAIAGHGLALDRPMYFYRSHSGSHTLDSSLAGRRRVYAAEHRFASDVIARTSPEDRLHALARSSRAVAAMKLRTTQPWTDTTSGPPSVNSGLADLGLADLARGIRLAARWRGHLAGW